MACCVCNGACNHIGAHSYCAAHGGSTNPTFAFTSNKTKWWCPPHDFVAIDGGAICNRCEKVVRGQPENNKEANDGE